MEKDFLNKALNEILNNPVIEQKEIPDIDLYMDQVTTLVEDKLYSTKRNDEDKLLTKTMINNYTKAGLIEPPVKKKYSKEHILRLIMIYNLKSILSINDIKTTFSNIEDNKYIYDKFVEIQNSEVNFLKAHWEDMVNNLVDKAENQKDACVSAVLLLSVAANYYKQMAEKLIDEHLTD